MAAQTTTAADIADYINAQAVATLGTDLFKYELSQSKNKQAVIIDTGGFEVDLPETYENVTIQVLVRGGKGEKYTAVHQFAREIHELLISNDITSNGNGYGYFFPTGSSGPQSVGKDSEDRFMISCNYFSFRNPFA